MQIPIQTTQKDEVIDITDYVEEVIAKQEKNEGLVTIFVQHTTCCITTADIEPGTDQDLLDALRGMLPNIHYRHLHDPAHAPDHLLSSIVGPSLTIPLTKGQLALGIWQRIILVELNGPRKRNLEVVII